MVDISDRQGMPVKRITVITRSGNSMLLETMTVNIKQVYCMLEDCLDSSQKLWKNVKIDLEDLDK